MPQRMIRLSEETSKRIEEAAERGGFSSPTAFMRYAMEQQLGDRTTQRDASDERFAATVEQLRRELVRVQRSQQALFAYLDTFSKTVLTCLPEPSADARSQAIARARERYDRLLKTVGKAMAGD